MLPRWALFLAVLVLAAPVTVRAGETRDQARSLADRGYELYQERRYEEANAHFREAERQYHAPTLVLMIARTYRDLGRIAHAERSYRRVIAEPLGPAAPQEFGDAREAARREFAVLAPRVPHVLFRFPAGGHRRVSVTIDGEPVPFGALPQPYAIDPGRHKIVVRRPGMAALQRDLDLSEGQRETIVVEVAPDRNAPLGPVPQGLGELQVGAVVSFVLAGVGLAGGIAGGVVALDQKARLEEVCPSRVCSPDDESLRDNGETAATLSTIGFVVAGVGSALGVTLLVLDASDEGQVEVTFEPNPLGFSLRGRF